MTNKTVEIEVTYFKPSGKWYMNEILSIEFNEDLYLFRLAISDLIKESRYKDEWFAVITDTTYIGFPMMVKL